MTTAETATQHAAGRLRAPSSPRARIGRQAVVDEADRVVGYDLHFAGAADDATGPPDLDADLRTCRMIAAAFGDLGLDRLGHRRALYVNTPRPFVTGRVPLPFSHQHVVLQLFADVQVDDEVVDGLRRIKSHGYRLAVDSGVVGPAFDQLYPMIDVLRIAVPWADPDLPDLVTYVRDLLPQAQLLADGITSHETLQAARVAGFDLFQGTIAAPEPDPAAAPRSASAKPSQIVSLQLLAALSDVDTTSAELERILSADPVLSLRILGAVNSASGAGREVGSLRQALVLLGRKQLSAWVMLAALGAEDGSREQLTDVLTRARTCELLADLVPGLDRPTAYAAGLLSGVVDLLGCDPVQVAREARLSRELAELLVHRAGPLADLVRAVEEFDRTGHADESLPIWEVSRARLHALGLAMATVDSVMSDG